MTFRFEKLKVWQEARIFSVEIYKLTMSFPGEERFSLSDQLHRAVVSIALNIAEESSRKSDKEFIRFLRVSIGSLEEVVTGLFIAKDLGYIKDKQFEGLYLSSNNLALKIHALIKSLQKL